MSPQRGRPSEVNLLDLKIDMHVHTCYSSDAFSTLREVIVYSKKKGLDGVAITDHDTLDGAQKLQGNDLIVIPGIEVTTLHGHVLALNVSHSIPSKLDINETIKRIHEAGGIAVAAHPTAFCKTISYLSKASYDGIEVINSAAILFPLLTYVNKKLATRLDLPQTAGSDSHLAPEIGSAYTIVKAEPHIDGIIQAITEGKTIPIGNPIPWRIRINKKAHKIQKRICNF
ncbi:MAG: CehA/McbA family metallohydrolase [Candidatus Hodarchaeota archaeon]